MKCSKGLEGVLARVAGFRRRKQKGIILLACLTSVWFTVRPFNPDNVTRTPGKLLTVGSHTQITIGDPSATHQSCLTAPFCLDDVVLARSSLASGRPELMNIPRHRSPGGWGTFTAHSRSPALTRSNSS